MRFFVFLFLSIGFLPISCLKKENNRIEGHWFYGNANYYDEVLIDSQNLIIINHEAGVSPFTYSLKNDTLTVSRTTDSQSRTVTLISIVDSNTFINTSKSDSMTFHRLSYLNYDTEELIKSSNDTLWDEFLVDYYERREEYFKK